MRASAVVALVASLLIASAGAAVAAAPSESPSAESPGPSVSPGPSGLPSASPSVSASPSASVTPFAVAPPDAAAAVSPAAAAPVRVLAGDFGFGLSLALDPSGHRHVVASRSNGDLWYATDRTGSWVSRRILRGQNGRVAWARPSVATDEQARVHIAVVRERAWDAPGSTGGIYYLSDAGRARGSFGSPVRITAPMMTGPSLRIEDGVRYLAYFRCLCSAGQRNAALFFRTDRGGTWTTERVAIHGVQPSLRLGPDGRAHIAYEAHNGLRYVVARTRLGDFGTSERLPGSKDASGPSLALTSAGTARLSWVSYAGDGLAQVLYTQRAATGWTAPRTLGPGHGAALSIDALDRPHVAIIGARVRHRWLEGGTWQAHLVTPGRVQPVMVAIRAFDRGANLAWTQRSDGVYVSAD